MSAIQALDDIHQATIGQPDELSAENLSSPCDPATLGFQTTDDLPGLKDVIGQPRAFRALELGAEVRGIGYNIFVLGVPDSGRTTLTRDYLRRKAALGPVSDDWVYVNNFENPHQPHGFPLPAGRAGAFWKDMQILVAESKLNNPRVFSSEEYTRERDRLVNETKQKFEREFKQLEEFEKQIRTNRWLMLSIFPEVVFQYFLMQRKKPFLASYKLTYRCNLNCLPCPFSDRHAPCATFDQVCQTLDRLQQRGNRIVIFEGGEPLLWQDRSYRFHDVVDYARNRFSCVGVTTNGTLPMDVATDVLWVSIDGFASTHNRLRQASIFDQVIANIRSTIHPRPYAHITANRENAPEIPELVCFLSKLVKGITVQFYYPYGSDDHLFLPLHERAVLLTQLIKLKKEGYPLLNSTVSLRALQYNQWRCWSWLVDCANPDGSIAQGCYLQGRAVKDCQKCGFSPYTEISLAFQGHPEAIHAGLRIF